MKISPERIQFHQELLDRFPSEEKCACDPAYGRWCAFHADFDTNMSHRSKELMSSVAARALELHEAIQDYLAYPVKGNHVKVSGAVSGTETLIELYLKERKRDYEVERERARRERQLAED